ncbi:putative LuxR family transcriptional regulator [Parafrankia sp. Ea1.12]|uniref:helix-turn-helix transcriptional regulator n=2 Tax=unclassified Parafrankia TaxID=2994368 RepID=UPI000DA58C3F|nr:helix-turn-helix transcriptional regulator [Parafrankia sp. Ea1.12]SQD99583.1 putative LuxR family transcriptional regulator [Parafrankia sp. Ea1.12]
MRGSTSTVESQLSSLADVCTKAETCEGLFEDVSNRLRRLVPFDGAGWFATDPLTVLATSPVRVENIENSRCESYWERECLVEDVLLFRDLARSESGVATLYTATDDQPARSARYREFIAPQGYGDELRAAFRSGGNTWGVVDLYRDRARARGSFTATEVELVRTLMPVIAAALRAFTTAVPTRPAAAGAASGPGTALFDTSGTLLSLDENAERLFAELAGPSWALPSVSMTPVLAVVARAAAVHEGRDRGPAAARLRAVSGRWISIHASCLRQPNGRPGPTALTIEPAKSAQIAPIIVEAYCLTVREQEITRAVARDLSNQEIAAELFLSPHTVRDHLKAVFAKVGVGSRGELVAKLFAEHYGPALHDPAAAITHVQY